MNKPISKLDRLRIEFQKAETEWLHPKSGKAAMERYEKAKRRLEEAEREAAKGWAQ